VYDSAQPLRMAVRSPRSTTLLICGKLQERGLGEV
jgi:hypothetical protein